MDLRALVPIASSVLTGLATQILVSAPGWTVRRLRRSPEGTALVKITADAVCLAFADAGDRSAKDLAWVESVALEWQPAFTPSVCTRLLAALSGTADAGAFRAAALQALHAAGADPAELGRVIDADEFLHMLPRRVFAGLRAAALTPDSAIRGIVGALLQQETAAAVEAVLNQASPREFRQDIEDLLTVVETAATSGGLPRFAPQGAGLMELTSPIRVRAGTRAEPKAGESLASGPYALAADRVLDERPVLDWRAAAVREDRVVVLGDPGMGKSWLICWETVRLARTARDALRAGASIDEVIIPVPVRCDELVLAEGPVLADAVCSYMADRYGVPARSQHRLYRHVTGGGITLLLDALDELPGRAARQRLDMLLKPWIASPRARFRMTSRIAGYVSVPALSPVVTEYELQPLTSCDVSALITAWGLPAGLAARLREQLDDGALAEVARIPLIAALLCATARDGDDLPDYAAGIYERVLRRFLAQENRWPHAPELEPTQIDQLIGMLVPLAFHFATRPEGWTDRMPASQITAVMRSLGPVFTELGQDAAAVLRDLSVRAGVLVPAFTQRAGHNPPYLFLHRAITEFLVAQYLASLARAEWLEAVREHMWFDTDWQPVIALLGAAFIQQERPGEAIILISTLLGQEPDPFSRALLTAVRVTAELPDPGLVPADLISQMAQRSTALLDSQDRYAATEFLRHHLRRLPQRFTEALLTRLDSAPDRLAVQILASSRDPQVISRLIRLLDADVQQRDTVYQALRGQEADCYISEMLTRFEDPQHRHRAAEVLATYTSPGVTQAILRRTGDEDAGVRLSALEIIYNRDDTGVTDALCRLAADSDLHIREVALDALARHGPAATAVFSSLLGDREPTIRAKALRGILTAPDAPLTAVLEFARSADGAVRSCAADALAVLTDSAQATHVLASLAADPDEDVRIHSARALSRHSGAEALAALLRLLDDPACARVASQSLACHDSPATAQLLLEWLGTDPSPDQLTLALRAAGGMSARGASDLVLAAITHEVESVRVAAVEALTGRPDKKATSALVTCLDDHSPEVRASAARALQATIDTPQLVAALLTHLSDSDSQVRSAAAGALTVSDLYPQVIPALLLLLSDAQEEVRIAAAAALTTAATPSALIGICDSPGETTRSIPRGSLEELASRVYRLLPDSKRLEVRQRLASIKLSTPPPMAASVSFGTDVFPDMVRDEFLDTPVIVLLQGKNAKGQDVYTYLRLTGFRLKLLFAETEAGRSYKPSDYGTVLSSGTGEPSAELRQEMNDKYGMT